MSSGEPIKLAVAKQVVEQFMSHLDGMLAYSCIAGSIRRGRALVGDAEVVIEPHNLSALWVRVDGLVNQGIIAKADYGAGQTRWGQAYRGVMYQGVKIELFVCDENNRGYITWLRTGAGQKNTYVMSQLKKHHSIIRMSGGYVWHVSYDKSHPAYKSADEFAKLGKLIVPDEFTLYWLLGMSPVEPAKREERAYRHALERGVYTPSVDEIQGIYSDPEPKQLSMF